tara:strand:+ start:158 stop:883 length:726 start_codon:yes stop_codon:yes gene_type:complete
MKKKIHLITYGNITFENAKQRLYKEANSVGWFDTVTVYGPEDLSPEFKHEFNDILKKPKGAGYWIWKFDIIKQQLNKLANNDILIYLDAGCSINTNGKTRFNEYIETLSNSNESVISFQMPHLEKKYTTKEIFNYFDMNVNDNNGNSGQIVGGILIMKNTDKMKKIIADCINVLRTDHLLVTDYYNKLGQCSDFIDNRHDQSILSLVRKKRGSIVLMDETYFQPFGNKESLKYPFWATRKR